MDFKPGSGAFAVSFANAGGDNVGALIDNVSISSAALAAIPEPQTYALMLDGLGVLGAVARRRRRA